VTAKSTDERAAEGRDSLELFVLPVGDAFLLHNPLLQVSSLVNATALDLFRQGLSGETALASLSQGLADLFMLLTEKWPDRQVSGQLRLQPQFLGIIPTRACNIACRYCDFGSGRAKHRTMSLNMAGAAVTWYADYLHQTDQTRMEIHFFGGEPFVARDVVETVLHRGRFLAARHKLEPHFEVSTNGVFERDYARFVGDYFHAVVLSFDGFQEIHDRHRPMDALRGSFDSVRQSALLLAESPTDLCLRCCVSSLNVERLEEIGDWFCREFQPAAINFESLTVNPETLAAGLHPPDPYLFAKNYSSARRRIQQHGIKPVYAATESEGLRTSFCPVGKDTLIVSPDGRISSCYLPQSAWKDHGLDMDVGRIDRNGRVAIDHAAIFRLRHLVTDKPRCINCFCRWTCSGGCHVSHTYPGSPLHYEDFCIQTRLLTACKLLDEMGQEQAAEGLLADKAAMEALAMNISDRMGTDR
jgi:uncharacterized protein